MVLTFKIKIITTNLAPQTNKAKYFALGSTFKNFTHFF